MGPRRARAAPADPPTRVGQRPDVHLQRGGASPYRGEGCHFQVALIARDRVRTRVSVCLYSSKTGVWSNINSLQLQLVATMERASTLIGNSLSWLLQLHRQHVIVEFDLDNQSLAVTEVPATVEPDCRNLWIMPAEDGGLGLIHISQFHGRLWKRKPDSDGLAVWVLYRAIDFDVLRSTFGGYSPTLVGVAEESKAIIVVTTCGVFMVYLQSMEFKKLSDEWSSCLHYPFACFYPAVVGTAIVDGHDGDEVLNNI